MRLTRSTKTFLLFAAALLLTAGLASAEQPASTDAEAVVAEGGGCVMPDLSGLSDEEAEAALRGAGFAVFPEERAEAVETAAPLCPQRFSCSSITNCGIGQLCSLSDIGPCCTTSSGLGICCIQGTIKVRRCPCVCTGNPCNILCPQSTDVQWRCS